MIDARVIDGVGLWFEQRCANVPRGRPALFLDRDGVVVEETHYLGRAEDVRMIAGAARTIRFANDRGFPVVMVTNQAGIGRGYYDWGGFAAVQECIHNALGADGAHVDLVLACAFHEKGLGRFAEGDHDWRKPNPGMIDKAADCLGLDLGRSLIIGDKWSDLEAGQAAGVGRGILVETGHGQSERSSQSPARLEPMLAAISRDISSALDLAIANGWGS